MKMIHIMPVNAMYLAEHSQYGMFLTHLVERNQMYRDAARKFRGYKILDNSLIELGGTVSMERLLTAAHMIDADEIILPDTYKDCYTTLKQVEENLEEARLSPYKIMAVAQGCDPLEFEYCLKTLSKMDGIDVIGIPKNTATLCPGGRPSFEHLWQNVSKEIHLLGLYYSFHELGQYRSPKTIRSIDTSLLAYFSEYNLPWFTTRADGFHANLELADSDINRLNTGIDIIRYTYRGILS